MIYFVMCVLLLVFRRGRAQLVHPRLRVLGIPFQTLRRYSGRNYKFIMIYTINLNGNKTTRHGFAPVKAVLQVLRRRSIWPTNIST